MPTRMLIAATVTLVMAIGCSPPPPEPELNIHFSEGMITVETPTGGSISMSNGINVTTDGLSLGLQNEQLKVDGKDFGKVSKGDKVKVEKSGKVSINGVERKPAGGP